MSDDASYLAFLEKANAPLPTTTSAQSQKVGLKAVEPGAVVPKAITRVLDREDVLLQSEADEPFDGVALSWGEADLPTTEAFAQLIEHPNPSAAHTDIEILHTTEWDKQNRYSDLIAAVQKAANETEVRIYRVPLGGARVEYWIVGVDAAVGQLVGAKALAIES